MGTRDDRERNRQSREALSKFFYDIGKYIFVGVVIGGTIIMRDEGVDMKGALFTIGGALLTAFFAAVGQHIINKKP